VATIREKGPHQWHVQIRRKGWPSQSSTFRTKKDAQAWARKIETDIDRGILIDQEAAQQTTFGDLIDIFLREVTPFRTNEKSMISERNRLQRVLREERELCSYAVSNLKPRHFEEYRDRRLGEEGNRGKGGKTSKPLKPSSVTRELATLTSVIEHSRRRLELQNNPVSAYSVQRPAYNDERDVRLNGEEWNRLLEACLLARNPLLHPVVEVALETGARQGNILELRWEDVDLQVGTALLRRLKNSRKPDAQTSHEIGLSPRAIAVLRSLEHAESGQVFPITSNALRLAFNRARTKAGVSHFRFHDIRHECISRLFEAGWTVAQVMAQTGHKDPKSVMRYTNISAAYLAEKFAMIDQGATVNV